MHDPAPTATPQSRPPASLDHFHPVTLPVTPTVTPPVTPPVTPAVILSAREAQIIALIVQGLSNDEIAATVFLSINSVKTYIRTAYRKIGVTRRAQAVVWGMTHGFAPDDGGDVVPGRQAPAGTGSSPRPE